MTGRCARSGADGGGKDVDAGAPGFDHGAMRVMALFLMMTAAAGSARAAPPPLAPEPVPEGGRCGPEAPCLRGLVCRVGTCELGGPCSATITYRGDDGATGTSRVGYSYAIDGRPMSRVETGAREVREETVLSRREHSRTVTTWDGVPRSAAPTRVETTVESDEGRADEVTVVDRSGDRERRWLITYLGGEDCAGERASTTRELPTGRLVARSEVRCGAEGRPTEVVRFDLAADGGERRSGGETWRYDDAGRLLGVDGVAGGGDGARRWSWRYLRDRATGRVVGRERDDDGDGRADVEETWDIGCWKTTPSAVVQDHEGGTD